MKKLAAIGLGVALAAATLTTSPQPAKADAAAAFLLGGLAVGLIVVGHHHPTLRTLPPWNWFHRHRCESRQQTHNQHTNLFFHKAGEQRHCVSP